MDSFHPQLRTLIQLNDDDPGLKALVEEFLTREDTGKSTSCTEDMQCDNKLTADIMALVAGSPSIPCAFVAAFSIVGCCMKVALDGPSSSTICSKAVSK